MEIPSTEGCPGPSSGLAPDALVRRYSETQLPTEHGVFRCVVYRDRQGREHVALVAGDVAGRNDVLCRVHSECLTGEAFGSVKCDCKTQLDRALERIAKAGCGVLLYLRQEGRGIGLGDKIRAYALQETAGLDTVDANRHLGLADDLRNYHGAATMLRDLGVESVALMTNNPLKVDGLNAGGVRVSKRVPHLVEVSGKAASYLRSKQDRMGHLGEPGASPTLTLVRE